MKKLMFAAAVAAVSTATFAEAISSSVVGYQTKDTVVGFNFVIPTFVAVDGTTGVGIQDIKIANATDWGDNIQILDEGGATVASYYYASAEQSGYAADGWLNENASDLADVVFAPGLSVLIDTADTATITFAGAVSTNATPVNTVVGFNFIGNNSPVAINIQDIKIANATDWGDNIQILDEGGATVASYYYASAEQSGYEADGWLNEDASGLSDLTIEPEQGFLVDTADEAVITLPGVSL